MWDILYSPMVVDGGNLPIISEELVEGALIDQVQRQLYQPQRIKQPVHNAEFGLLQAFTQSFATL